MNVLELNVKTSFYGQTKELPLTIELSDDGTDADRIRRGLELAEVQIDKARRNALCAKNGHNYETYSDVQIKKCKRCYRIIDLEETTA